MAKIRYRKVNFEEDTLALILRANAFISEYKGHSVTLRQIYYRFIATDTFPTTWIDAEYNQKHKLDHDTKNTDKNYKRLGKIISNARYAGLIDWDHIEDRNRFAAKPRDWENASFAIQQLANSFRLDRWATQPFYIELMVEKAALVGVLNPISQDYHITLMANKGYSSATAMKESADRISYRSSPNANRSGKRPIVIYIGDHDPSGVDMARDVRDRLLEFGCPEWLDVRKLALTFDQVEKYNPPPNPAKVTDSRAKKYIEKFGHDSWEVDALPPDVLDQLVRKTLNSYIDKQAMDTVISEENRIKEKIKKAALSIG